MHVVELAGGVGGARLADGLQARIGAALTVIVNTGDDLERHGLAIWPDHDTVLYTLASLDDEVRGWGLAGETWAVIDRLTEIGEETWFRLGDRDIATHLVRTDLLRRGVRPTEVAATLRARFRVPATILPMTDSAVRTQVRTDDGWLDFQEYFVHRAQAPTVHEVRFRGVEAATPSPEVLASIEAADLVVVAPSNPIVSVAPILAVPGMQSAIDAARARGVPVVAVSGIVGGRALKGPADRMLQSLGHTSSALGVARLYAGLVDLFVLDALDAHLAPEIEALGMRAHVTDTIMSDDVERERLAGEILTVALGDAVALGDQSRGPGAPRPIGRPRTADLSRTWALVPVRGLEGAKLRLGGQLDAEERYELVSRLLIRVIAAARDSGVIERTVVISPDVAALDLAEAAGATPQHQSSDGLNAALADGRAAARAGGARAILVLPADLPAADAAAVVALLDSARAALAAEGARPLVALVPDRHGTGTNALLLSPPDVIDFSFGPDSRADHRSAANDAGATYLELDGPLTLDIDTADDLVLVEQTLPEVLDVS
jgi:LPPG:FO 2-phospho-L-lactate transferase